MKPNLAGASLAPGVEAICALIGLMLVTSSNLRAQPALSGELMRAASRSIVKIECRGTGTGEGHAASGFVWGQSNTVVTALHVVAGSNTINVYFESVGVKRRASILRVLKRADLALLQVENAPTLSALLPASVAPQVNDEVVALGYPLNIPSLNSTSLRLRYGGKRLKDIVPAKVADEIRRNGYPDVEAQIINLEGHLLPGLSGAPILDGAGRVVAIADGGLENGAVAISWGLPVSELQSLVTSTESLHSREGMIVANLFAADLQLDLGETIRCGGAELRKVRTRNFLELAQSSDDPVRLFQLSAVLGFDQAAFEYDIYQHLESGATVVIPAGMDLTARAGMCTASLANGQIELNIQIAQLNSAFEVQNAALRYEAQVMPSQFLNQWQPDLSWSYLMPMSRYDGLVVNRKAMIKYGYNWGYPITEKSLYETLASRGNVLIGYTVINHDYTPQAIQNAALCGQGYSLPQCPQIFAAARDWARMVLAVHLTSFSL